MAKRSRRSVKSRQVATLQAIFRRCHRDPAFRDRFVAICREYLSRKPVQPKDNNEAA
jgi:hypothetical protein